MKITLLGAVALIGGVAVLLVLLRYRPEPHESEGRP
jgi:hypothetical protein